MTNTSNSVPRLEGSIIIVFPPDANVNHIVKQLPQIVETNIHRECMEIICIKTDCIYSFFIDDLLSELFAVGNLKTIHTVAKNFGGKILIDIAFYHNDIYPALVFEGKNMEIIHSIDADICIDPY